MSQIVSGLEDNPFDTKASGLGVDLTPPLPSHA
jgi:hypothetical protein